MISKTKIKGRIKRKGNPEIVETVIAANKKEKWSAIAQLISGSSKKYSSINLNEIEKQTSAGDTVVVPGKVLGAGNVSKKVRVCAVNFSECAREKLKDNKGEIVTILEEIKKNPNAEGVKIIR
jgi:large subunit ribosomal protein L18e